MSHADEMALQARDQERYNELDCIDGPEGCDGKVLYRTTPDRCDGRSYPRCVAHFERRLAQSDRNMELLSDVPPRWFDPGFAGERWDDD